MPIKTDTCVLLFLTINMEAATVRIIVNIILGLLIGHAFAFCFGLEHTVGMQGVIIVVCTYLLFQAEQL